MHGGTGGGMGFGGDVDGCRQKVRMGLVVRGVRTQYNAWFCSFAWGPAATSAEMTYGDSEVGRVRTSYEDES